MKAPQELLALATINPELDQIIQNGPPLPIVDVNSNIHTLRARQAEVKKAANNTSTTQGETSYSEEDRQIPVRDGTSITVRVHRPKVPPKDGSPGLVTYHGGGWCLGGLDNELMICRKWTELGGVAVNVDYRLAPEHPFPVPVHDAFDALKWTSTHVDELNINPGKGFLVGGTSAGANLAAVLSHLYRDEKISPPLTGVYLSIPLTLEPEACPDRYKNVFLSREQNKDAPILSTGTLALLNRLYKADPLSPLRSPFLFPSHKDLPSTYLQICGLDPLRDEGFIYEDTLRECGTRMKVDVYPGLPHGFWSWFPEAGFTKRWQLDYVEGLSWLLENKA